MIPPNSFALARTVEYFKIPRNVLTICLGKSTYARCGIIVNVTPFEPEWEGFVTLEFSTFGFYVLVAYLREDLASNEAGLKFFILGVFAAGLLAYGISLVYGETGKLVFSDMASAPATPGLIIGFLLIFAALGFKIGAVPFHTWIPDTYHGAPTPVTAFLSIAPKGAAIAILLRLFFVALFAFKPMWVLLLAAVSVLSMTYANIVAIAQTNIKIGRAHV